MSLYLGIYTCFYELVLGVTLRHCLAPAAELKVMNGKSELETEIVKTVLAVGG